MLGSNAITEREMKWEKPLLLLFASNQRNQDIITFDQERRSHYTYMPSLRDSSPFKFAESNVLRLGRNIMRYQRLRRLGRRGCFLTA
jgi:hypothetical protein